MKDNLEMEEVLKELGWTDGFRIPVANEENRALELEIQKKQKEKDNLKSALEDVDDRLSAMRRHLDNVHHELDQNQNLIAVQENQIKTEENLKKSCESEEKSLTNDIKRLKKEHNELENRHKTIQMDISKVNGKLEKLKGTAKWNEDALLAWDEEISRGYDDMLMLEKFTKEDEIKFNELELRRQNLRMELENKRLKVNNAKNDLVCMEQSLEKTAQLFRKEHENRKALVRQWESSVLILHQRDEDINRAVEEIANLKVLAKNRVKILEEQKSFYEIQLANNKELEKEIALLGNESSEKKEHVKSLEENVKNLEVNESLVRNLVEKVHSEVRSLRSQRKQLLKDIEGRVSQTDEAKRKLERAQQQLESVKTKSFSAADRMQRLQDMIHEEDKNLTKIDQDIKKLSELMFQVVQQVQELKEGERVQKAYMRNIESSLALNKKQLQKVSEELNRYRELIYNKDFQIMEKDIQLNRMLGLAREENGEKYEKKYQELEEVHSQLMAKNSLLTRELSRLEEERNRLTVEMQNDSKELDFLRNKTQKNVFLTQGGLKQLKQLKAKNEDKQVEENVLKLRVRQSEKALNKLGGNLFSMEKQKLELEEAMKEREIEINLHRDIMNVRKRVLSEQASNLSGRINMGKIKVEHLKKKYEITVSKLGTDEDGQPLSATYFKIKSAQEKFQLQETGDKLDMKIKKTEKEITAMENTLKVVNASNRAFRKNLACLDENSPEFAEKEELDRNLINEMDELRKKRMNYDELNEEAANLETEYNELVKKEAEVIKSWQEKKGLITQMEKELKDQEEKLARAEKQLKKYIKEIRGSLEAKFRTIEEKDIELRELKEQNQSGLQQYAELVAKTIDTGPVVTRYLSEKGLELPLMKSPSESIKYASTSSLHSPCGDSLKSGHQLSARSTASSLVSPSVVNLNSSKIPQTSGGQSTLVRKTSSVRFASQEQNKRGKK